MVIRRYFDAADEVFEMTVTVHPAERFTFSMELTRSRGSALNLRCPSQPKVPAGRERPGAHRPPQVVRQQPLDERILKLCVSASPSRSRWGSGASLVSHRLLIAIVSNSPGAAWRA